MSNTVFQKQTIKVRVKDNGSLQSTTPVTLKNAVGQKRSLTELFDVNIIDPANSQILVYQANNYQWVNRTATTIAGNTNQIVVANTNNFDFALSLPDTVTINQSLGVGNGFSTNSSVTTVANGNFGTINVSSAYIANGIIVGGSAALRNIIPDANNAYTIGNSSFRYATLWLSGNTFYMGNVVFTDTATSLGLTTSNGSPISVNMGNTVVNGSLSVASSFQADSLAANTLTVNRTSNLVGNSVFANSLFVDSVNSRIGIKNATPDASLTITGTANISGNVVIGGTTTFAGPLSLGTSALIANGGYGTSGQVLTTNGTATYWSTSGTTLNANNTDTATYYLGLSGTSTGLWTNAVVSTTKLSFVPSTGTLSTVTVSATNVVSNGVNANTLAANIVTFNTSANVGANVQITTSQLFVGNSTVNATHTSAQIQVANSTSTANLTPTSLTIGTSVVNSTAHAIGGNVVLTSTNITVGNATVNSAITSSVITSTNVVSNGVNANTLTANIATFNTSANVGANVQLTTTGWSVGNATANVVANSSFLVFGTISNSGIAFYNAPNAYNITMRAYTDGSGGRLDAVSDYNMYFNMNAGTNRGFVFRAGNTTSIPVTQIDGLGNIWSLGNHYIGNSTVNSTITSTTLSINAVSSNVATFNTSANVGANVQLTTSQLSIGNATVNTVITSTNSNFSSGKLFVDATNSRVGINNTTPDASLSVTGTANVSGNMRVGGTLTVGTTFGVGNTTITGFANVVGNLQVTDTFAGNNMTLTGNLTVSGTTTYVNTTTLNIGDNIITLNADLLGATAPTENSGFEVNRGSQANVQFIWDETNKYWSMTNTFINGTASVNTSISIGNSSVNVTSNSTTITTKNITISGALTANGSLGTNGQTLTTNGTAAYWSTTGVALNANNTDTATYYLGMTSTSTGLWTNAVVSTTQMSFVPSSGLLTVGSANVQSSFYVANSTATHFRVLPVASAVNYIQVSGAITGGTPTVQATGSDANVTLVIAGKGNGGVVFDNPGYGNYFGAQHAGATVTNANFVRVVAAATGTGPSIRAVGSDANIDFNQYTLGTGGFNFLTGTTSSTQFKIIDTAGATNWVQVYGSTGSGAVTIGAAGSNTNIATTLSSKGSGDVNLAAGSGGWVSFNPGGVRQVAVKYVASAVNYIVFNGAAVGSDPTFDLTYGSDPNVGLNFLLKGTGVLKISGATTVNGAFTVSNTAALGNTTITGFANVSTTMSVGANVIANTTTYFVGNSTVYAYTNSTAQYLVGTGGTLSAPTIVANNQFQIQDAAGATQLRLVGSGATGFIQAGSNSTNGTAELVIARTTTLNSTVANVKVFAVSTMFAGGNLSITSGVSSIVPDATLSVIGTANVSGNVAITSATASGNNVSGALIVSGGIGVSDSVYVKNKVGFANSTNVSVVYQYYNAATNSLDTVFG